MSVYICAHKTGKEDRERAPWWGIPRQQVGVLVFPLHSVCGLTRQHSRPHREKHLSLEWVRFVTRYGCSTLRAIMLQFTDKGT